jgi:hypothetical protein
VQLKKPSIEMILQRDRSWNDLASHSTKAVTSIDLPQTALVPPKKNTIDLNKLKAAWIRQLNNNAAASATLSIRVVAVEPIPKQKRSVVGQQPPFLSYFATTLDEKIVDDNTLIDCDTALTLRFFSAVHNLEQRRIIEPHGESNSHLAKSPVTAAHRRPGYHYVERPNLSRRKQSHVIEDTLYISGPSLHQSSRTGGMDRQLALQFDRETKKASRRLRRVSMSTVPIPRVASMTTQAMRSSQRTKVVKGTDAAALNSSSSSKQPKKTTPRKKTKMVFGRRQSGIYVKAGFFGALRKQRVILSEDDKRQKRLHVKQRRYTSDFLDEPQNGCTSSNDDFSQVNWEEVN